MRFRKSFDLWASLFVFVQGREFGTPTRRVFIVKCFIYHNFFGFFIIENEPYFALGGGKKEFGLKKIFIVCRIWKFLIFRPS